MKLSDFDYKLPLELIAQEPLAERNRSRMLILHMKTGRIEHRHFFDLPNYLNQTDAVVLNDTKVFKARLIAARAGCSGKIELLLLKQREGLVFECLAKPARKLKIGTTLEFGNNGIRASVIGAKEELRLVKFNGNNLYSWLETKGLVPLPPYIKRQPKPEDETRYQTVYARNTGAVAAPTAGLHFTTDMLEGLKKKGVGICYLTLHVGYATFRPVDCDDITRHKMHSEYFEVSRQTTDKINNTKKCNGRILAVGTTVCRSIEAAAELRPTPYSLHPKKSYTNIFIYPGYDFKMTDMLLTNFHLPRTTLLMLVCAFAGRDNVMRAYAEAIDKRYRFYSYGDCMLII